MVRRTACWGMDDAGNNVEIIGSNYARGGWFINKANCEKYAEVVLSG